MFETNKSFYTLQNFYKQNMPSNFENFWYLLHPPKLFSSITILMCLLTQIHSVVTSHIMINNTYLTLKYQKDGFMFFILYSFSFCYIYYICIKILHSYEIFSLHTDSTSSSDDIHPLRMRTTSGISNLYSSRPCNF